MLANITFEMGTEINTILCGDIEVIDDTALETEEEFSIYASGVFIRVTVFGVEAPEQRNDSNASFPIVLPCNNADITIAASDIEG